MNSTTINLQGFHREVAVDTGPLFDFLLLEFAETSRRVWLLEKLRYADTTDKQQLLKEYFRKWITTLYTTPGVVVEIYHHISKVFGKQPYDIQLFLETARDYLLSKNINEEVIPFIQLQQEQPQPLARLGPCDISILELARKMRKAVLTADSPLYSECTGQSILCYHIDDLFKLVG